MVRTFSNKCSLSIGLDMRNIFGDKLNNTEFFIAEGQDIPLKDESIDLVFSIGVLEHVVNYEKMLREMQRVLKKSGFMIVFCGPTKFWKDYTGQTHKSIIMNYPDVKTVYNILGKDNIKKIWNNIIFYNIKNTNNYAIWLNKRIKESKFPYNYLSKIIYIFIKIKFSAYLFKIVAFLLEYFNLEITIAFIYKKPTVGQ